MGRTKSDSDIKDALGRVTEDSELETDRAPKRKSTLERVFTLYQVYVIVQIPGSTLFYKP